MTPIYADYNGSSPLSPEVITYLKNRLSTGPYANPNAMHLEAKKVMTGIRNARILCTKNLGATESQMIFKVTK